MTAFPHLLTLHPLNHSFLYFSGRLIHLYMSHCLPLSPFYYFFGLVSLFPHHLVSFLTSTMNYLYLLLRVIIFGAVQYLSHQSSTPPYWQLLLQSVYLKPLKFHSLLPPTQTKSLHHHIHPLATTSLTLLPSPPSPIHIGFFSP